MYICKTETQKQMQKLVVTSEEGKGEGQDRGIGLRDTN